MLLCSVTISWIDSETAESYEVAVTSANTNTMAQSFNVLNDDFMDGASSTLTFVIPNLKDYGVYRITVRYAAFHLSLVKQVSCSAL